VLLTWAGPWGPAHEPLLASLAGASVRGRIATGRRAGQAVLRLGDREEGASLGMELWRPMPRLDPSSGMVKKGKGGEAARTGETALGGRIPVNTSGGLKSKGHPVGATGIAQAIEICEQLRDESGDRQVKGAKIGLTQNMGGSGASSVVHIFGRV